MRQASGSVGVRLEPLEARMLLSAVTVNLNDVRQTIDGFGASSAWASGTIPDAALNTIFSPVTGAGLTLLRSRIGPNGTTNENLWMQQVGAFGVKVWSTPWTPPREWKTNHDTNNGGTFDPAHYQDYANDLADYVQNMSRQGIPMYAVSLQNEPNWTADYESCRWSAVQFAEFLPIVGAEFGRRGITTKIMLPEGDVWEFSLANTVMANPSLAQYVGILAAHDYGSNAYTPCTIAGGRPVWETEISTFAGGTEINKAVDVADNMHRALSDANVNAWHYWWLNYSGDAALVNGWNATKRLWAMGQYSKFVRPGWVRVGETDDGGLDITTFKDPASGKFAIVVVNMSTTNPVTEMFTLNGGTASSVTPYVTSATDDLAAKTAINLAGGTSFTAAIGPQSIVTYYGTLASAAPLQAPTNLFAAASYNNTATQIAISWSDNSSAETGYTVERSTDGANWTVITSSLPANSFQYTDTGRSENTTYYYRVKLTNGDATTYSSVVRGYTVLKAPSNLNGTRVSGGINLTWTVNSAAAAGVTVARSTDGLNWTTAASLAAGTSAYSDVIPGYNANQMYYYRVRNTSTNATSAFASYNTTLATPTNVTATPISPSSVTFNWTNVSAGASGAWIEEYYATSSRWIVVSPTSLLPTANTWTINGLTAGTIYSFRLRASSDADAVYSNYTSTLNVTTGTPSPDPVVWYKTDESGGTILADSSGNGEHATLTGSYGFTPGINGNALNLTGGYATTPSGIVSSLVNFTVAVWINPASLDSWARIFDFGTSTNNYMFLTVDPGGSDKPRFAITTGSGEQTVSSSVTLTANTWTHLAVTLSGTSATLYLNGTVVGTSSNMTLSPYSLGTTTHNYLGDSQFSNDPTFKGLLDDFRIYERALSASEIQAMTQTAPTVARAAKANPSPVTGTYCYLTVLGADQAGESTLTYTWSTTGTPPAPVTYSNNGTNSAKAIRATFSKAGTYNFSVAITNRLGLSVYSTVSVTVYSSVAARRLFYAGSAFDGDTHDNAIASDKTALLPGQTATFANYSSYSRGINGILLDLVNPAGAPTASDFVFHVGNDSDPSGAGWTTAPDPISILALPPSAGVTRIVLNWADNAVEELWLQVTLKGGPGSTSGLIADDTFYFGNAIGDTGLDPASARVNALDLLVARANATASALITDPCDFNRDAIVDLNDEIIARSNVTWFGDELRLISPSAGSSASAPASTIAPSLPLSPTPTPASPSDSLSKSTSDTTSDSASDAVVSTTSLTPGSSTLSSDHSDSSLGSTSALRRPSFVPPATPDYSTSPAVSQSPTPARMPDLIVPLTLNPESPPRAALPAAVSAAAPIADLHPTATASLRLFDLQVTHLHPLPPPLVPAPLSSLATYHLFSPHLHSAIRPSAPVRMLDTLLFPPFDG
jgi:glucuronoarabinoxylan endo-1,4-beta-xylanase